MEREIRYGPEIIFSYLYRVTLTFDHQPNRGHCLLMGSLCTKSHEDKWKGKADVIRKSFSVIHVLWPWPLDPKIDRGHPCRDIALSRCRVVALSRCRDVALSKTRDRDIARWHKSTTIFNPDDRHSEATEHYRYWIFNLAGEANMYGSLKWPLVVVFIHNMTT